MRLLQDGERGADHSPFAVLATFGCARGQDEFAAVRRDVGREDAQVVPVRGALDGACEIVERARDRVRPFAFEQRIGVAEVHEADGDVSVLRFVGAVEQPCPQRGRYELGADVDRVTGRGVDQHFRRALDQLDLVGARAVRDLVRVRGRFGLQHARGVRPDEQQLLLAVPDAERVKRTAVDSL